MSTLTPFAIPAGNGQVYRFTGTMLSSSESKRPGVHRWIAFALYRTSGGAYILSRIGHSLLYHSPDCAVVERNKLQIAPMARGGIPCELCEPSMDAPICPETPRYWAGIFQSAPQVLEALWRSNGQTKYVTNVAARLVEQAAIADAELAMAWTEQRID